MAARRMFSTAFVESDAFLDLSRDAQLLYFHMGLSADDDGFLGNPMMLRRAVCPDCPEALKELIDKEYLIAFPSGRVVIRHWRLNNYLRSDRYTPSTYPEKALIDVDDYGVYHLKKDAKTEPETDGIPGGIPGGIPSIGKVSIDKVSIDKVRVGKSFNILTTGEPLTLTETDLTAYKQKYEHVDIEKSVAKCAAHLETHPQARRSPEGTRAYLERWLADDEERDRKKASAGLGNEGASYDIDRAVRDASKTPTVKKRHRHDNSEL